MQICKAIPTVDEEDGFSYVGLGDLRRLRMSLYLESDRFLTLSVGPISVMDMPHQRKILLVMPYQHLTNGQRLGFIRLELSKIGVSSSL